MKKVVETFLREPVLLTFVLLSAAGTWAFVELADVVEEGESRAIDEWMILALRVPGDPSDPIGPRWFEEVMRDYTALGGYGILTPLTLSAMAYLWIRGHHRLAVWMMIAVVGGLLISTALKSFFHRPRPDLVPHGSIALTTSFPSGHAMMAATSYLTLGAIIAQAEKRRSLKLFFLILGILLTFAVGISRLYLGVHWPTDILAGWAAGAAWALACWTVAHYIKHRKRYTGRLVSNG